MNRQSGPESKLRLRQLQVGSEGRENQQSHGIQNEDCAQRYGHLFVAGPRDRPDGSDCAAPTNCCTGGNEKCRNPLHTHQRTQAHSDEQREADAEHGIDEAATSSVNDLVEIHSEPESYHRGLKQELRNPFCSARIWMRKCEAEHETHCERDRRGDESASADQQAKKKNYARKHSSKAWSQRIVGPVSVSD